jgi:hypothetical protein
MTSLVTAVVAHFAVLNHRAAKAAVVSLQVFSARLSDGLFGGMAKGSLTTVCCGGTHSYEDCQSAISARDSGLRNG